MSDIEVTVYFGPLTWFMKHVDLVNDLSLLELFLEEDAESRRLRVVTSSDDTTHPEEAVRPSGAYMPSSDFASLNEHVITNFAGNVRRIRPERLLLHNPPAQVLSQVDRSFGASVVRYSYPTIDVATLRAINDGYSKKVVGQDLVKERLLAALLPLSRANRTRPVVVMFYGPSGVGKTETAKYVNKLLGGTLFRKQFSMYHNDRFASYVFGGKHSEQSFARDLLDRESGVILIDEFDKANSVFHSAFYELFDGGVFVDKNYALEVGPAVIICTSNYSSESEIQEALGEALFSRFDAMIGFRPLEPAQLRVVVDDLVDKQVKALSKDERALLDKKEIKRLLGSIIERSSNVRILQKTVTELIATLLVRATFEADARARAAED